MTLSVRSLNVFEENKFTSLGRSVLGKTALSVLNTARVGRQASGGTQDGGHSFSQYGPPGW